MGFWDKVKGLFGGKSAVEDVPASPTPAPAPAKTDEWSSETRPATPSALGMTPPPTAAAPTPARARRPSNRSWNLERKGDTLALVAPHGTFEVKGIADSAKADFAKLAQGQGVRCEGEFEGGGSITELVVTRIEAPIAAPVRAPAPAPVQTASAGFAPVVVVDEESRWKADQILGLSAADLRTRALKINPYRTPWIGRVDTIPPQSDERTAIIDRGLILRGLLTPEQITEIHRVGDLWLQHHDALKLAEAAAHRTADAAIEAARAKKAALKAEKQRIAAEKRAARRAAIAERRATDIIYAGRGVSARLGDRRAHVEELAKHGVPVLASPGDVARALSLTIPQLRWLCFHAEAAARPHYVYFEIPKRSGGTRLLAAPQKKLAAAQRWIFENILSKLAPTSHAHGFVPSRSTVTNARPHVGKAIVVNLDLKDFFPSVTFPRVRGLFESLGYSPSAATLLALISTEAPRRKVLHDGNALWVAVGDRALPQGACTSPAISNLVCRKLDRRLAGAAAKLGWTYTRYADDLSFSASSAEQLSLMMSRARAIVRDEGFTVNEDKGSVLRASGRQRVTGIVVNEKPGIPREEVRRLRAILHAAKNTGLAAQNRENRADFDAYLRGKIAYLSMIDPAKGKAMLALLDQL